MAIFSKVLFTESFKNSIKIKGHSKKNYFEIKI